MESEMNVHSCYYCVFTINFTVSVDSTPQNREEDKTFFESQRVNEALFLAISPKFDMATGTEECGFEAVRSCCICINGKIILVFCREEGAVVCGGRDLEVFQGWR